MWTSVKAIYDDSRSKPHACCHTCTKVLCDRSIARQCIGSSFKNRLEESSVVTDGAVT